MKKSIVALLLIGLSILLISCSADSLDKTFIVDKDFAESDVRFISIDTFTVEMSTIKLDSVITSGGNKLLIGQYTDPFFGKVTSSAFMTFIPKTYTISEEAVFDSIVLSLKYDGYFYGDTLRPKTVLVQKLSKELKLGPQQTAFYNTSEVPTFSPILASKTFNPRISKDSLTLKLDPMFGKDLFDKFRGGTIRTDEDLKEFFKGLKLFPGADENASLIAFKGANSFIRMYYSKPDQPNDKKTFLQLEFDSKDTGAKSFNQIIGDRSGTPLSGLLPQNKSLSSTALDNLSFLQGGAGIAAKVRFPHIRTISQINGGKGHVFNAKMKIKLSQAYYTNKLYLSDSLQVFVVDGNNNIINEYTDSKGKKIKVSVAKQDKEFNEVFLILPVDVFLQKIINEGNYLEYGLLVLPYSSQFGNRMVLNGENNPEYSSNLKVIYATYDK